MIQPEALELRRQIRLKARLIYQTQNEIIEIAMIAIPDFHFLDWRVSTLWKCDKSPIGMCVFPALHIKGEPYCRYCDDPEERK